MRAILAALCAALVLAGGTRAWEGHDWLTREALRDVDWLDAVPPLPVTTRSDSLQALSPRYAFASLGESPGETIAARVVLERYAGEPDRGPDDDMLDSWQQLYLVPLAGHSSRRYHQSSMPGWSVHFPLTHVAMGAAPERASLYFHAARRAFDRGDPYWGFRYVASLLHYAQDAAQPYHAGATAPVFLLPGDHPPAAAIVMANYHALFQGWVHRRMEDSAFELSRPLRGTAADAFRHADEGVERVAERSRELGLPLFEASVRFFDRRFRKAELESPSFPDLAQLEPAADAEILADCARRALGRAARASRGMLALIRPLIRERFLEPLVPRAAGRPGAP
ncbi:MAG: hypothetical protein HYY25_04730 [Candidatus Wallbacteria bacterium]|nr:hypothetical protein [Candidatus Wallbacteria bacterium]